MDEQELPQKASQLQVGKRLPGAVYLHRSLLAQVPEDLSSFVTRIASALKLEDEDWNVAKLHHESPKISYLKYRDFDDAPYPELECSKMVDLARKSVRDMDFSTDTNPPILHRKELLVPSDYPGRGDFEEITREGEAAGLYQDTRRIGFKKQWITSISLKGYELVDGRLFRASAVSNDEHDEINRERTAISRTHLSAPMQILSKNGFLEGNYSVCDYGCGRGDDLAILESLGIDAVGWDPNHRPEGERLPSDVVNLGFVVNVIEDREERDYALRSAFKLSERLLIVSAMLGSDEHIAKFRPFKDGVITSRKTFQKYYAQSELKEYIESTLETSAIAAASGIFLVFNDEALEAEYVFARHQRRRGTRERSGIVRKSKAERLVELVNENVELCTAYWIESVEKGRWAVAQETEHVESLCDVFGSLHKAQRAVLSVFDEAELNQAEKVRESEVVFSQAMSFFQGRSPFSELPEELQRDVRYFFGSYKELQARAQALLSMLTETDVIDAACVEYMESGLPHYYEEDKTLTIPSTSLLELPLALRTYIGCAEQLVGSADQFALIKIHIHTGKVSFMNYEGYATKPIPELIERIKVDLWNQRVDYFDYVYGYSPKPLYWKSLFLLADDDDYAKQRSFDQKLDELGLAPENPHFGFSKADVLDVLKHKGLEIKGHRFYRVK